MKEIIRVTNLMKSYGKNKVIDDVSFSINKGEILCYLGPNGAGKSTMINILTGAIAHDAGEVTYNGRKIKKDDREFKRKLGVVPQELALYEDITAEQNIRFFASLYGLKGKVLNRRTAEALAFSGLAERVNDQVKTFSGGMKRRLNIACAIAHRPEILIMDEPTVGIDPQSSNHILRSVKKMRERGMTIIYTTHYMEEVEEIATRIIIMDKGKIIATGSKEDLKESIANTKKIIIDVDPFDVVSVKDFYSVEGVKEVMKKNNKLEITVLTGVENLDKLISLLMNQQVKIHHISSEAANLETVFLNLTGRKLRN